MRCHWVAGLFAMVLMAPCASGTGVAATYKLTTLADFNPAEGGYGPFTKLAADAQGNLYGTTLFGGPNDRGTVFKLVAGTHELTTLATFSYASGQRSDGGLLLDASGNIYGTTVLGGAFNDGTVFRLDAGSNTITTLATFNGTNGGTPFAELIADADGNLFGTTRLGGTHNKGTAFRLAAGTHELTTLASFDGANGAHPTGGLIADATGNFYGTTGDGGTYDHGTVFRIAAGSRTQRATVSRCTPSVSAIRRNDQCCARRDNIV